MIKRFLLPVGLALLTCSISQAGVTGVSGSGDGGVTSAILTLSPDATSVDITADQLGAGGILGSIGADGDPTLTLNNAINNDTGFTWTSYGVTISMDQSFSIGTTPIPPYSSNPGWSLQSLVQPVLVGSLYVGQIDFIGGTVPDGSVLNFTYQITFNGGASFTQTLTPNAVPEPGTLSLLAGGLLLLVGGRRLIKRS